MLKYNKNLKSLSRELRNNMTDSEKLLWGKIRRKQLKSYQFYRQRTIGDYIVDFYCPKAGLIIEVDGGQHYSDKGKRKDKIRDVCMESLGMRVLRFSDKKIFGNLEGVLKEIGSYL